MDLVGREAELALVADRLRHRRLVTLVGPGGIGKTALGRAVLGRCRAAFPEGGHVVDLTRVDSPAAVPESIAAQLGYASFRALLDAPGDHDVLLLVDNCEHVVDAVADALDRLLHACERPTILATSRSALEVPGETLVPVGPLALPGAAARADASAAVRLFVERASDVGVQVEPDDVVAELCRRLDGVPLAIELAAARARAMTPAEVLDRLGGGLEVLDRPRRRSARRHQSLRAAIGWSYDLLGGDEQALFDRLSVLAGPFTATMAHAVAAAPGATFAGTQDLLDGLVSASMVVADPAGPVTRYRLLETLRAYGLARLDERGERRGVEARFAAQVTTEVAGIVERGASTWAENALAELLDHYGHVTAALRWCIAHDDAPDRAFLLVAALWGVVHQAHTEEVGTLAAEALARWPARDDPEVPPPLRADAVATSATCRYMGGDTGGAIAEATQALSGAEASPYAPATLRRAVAQASRAFGDTAGALRWFADTADHARRLGLLAMAVEADAGRAQVLADVNRLDDALRLVRHARREAADVGSAVAAAWAEVVEGSVLLRVDVDRAASVLDAALATSRRLGHAAGVSAALRCLALAALCHGDTAAAAGFTLELLESLLAAGSTDEMRLVLDVASATLARAGRTAPAADLAATALALPVVSITASVGHELFPPDPAGGTRLATRDAIVLARSELRRLAGVGATIAGTDAGSDASADASADTDAVHAAPAVRGPAAPAEPRGVDTADAVFRRAGDVWEVAYAGQAVSLRASKGLADIARLLATPGREVHCLDLAGGGLAEEGTGEVLDDAARRAYERRVRDLQQDLEDAEADHDVGRAERARAELDAVVDQLTAALGLGGRSRRSAGSAERARTTVTQRVRATIRRVEDTHPRLGRHLRASVRTGTFCSYVPEAPVDWRL